MKRIFSLSLVLSLLLFSGCQTRAARAYTARVLLTAAVNDTIVLREQHKLDDQQFAIVRATENALKPIPDELDLYAANDPVNFERLYLEFAPKISALIQSIAEAKAKPRANPPNP